MICNKHFTTRPVLYNVYILLQYQLCIYRPLLSEYYKKFSYMLHIGSFLLQDGTLINVIDAESTISL